VHNHDDQAPGCYNLSRKFSVFSFESLCYGEVVRFILTSSEESQWGE